MDFMAFFDIELYSDQWEELEAWKREDGAEAAALEAEFAGEPFVVCYDHSAALPF
jgi:hypothetical protein